MLAFLRGLVARGLSGVELVTSDAHQGLREAIATVFGGASWQRCRTHFMRNLLTRVPKSAEALVATTARTICQQPSASEVHAQHARVVEQLGARFPEAAPAVTSRGARARASFTSAQDPRRCLLPDVLAWPPGLVAGASSGIRQAGCIRLFYHRDLATDPVVSHDHILVLPSTLSGVRLRVQRPVWARSVL